MRCLRTIAIFVVLSVTLAGCFGGSSSKTRTHGISWRLDNPDAFDMALHPLFLIPLLEQSAQAQLLYADSDKASGYWIPDPIDPLGKVVGLQAWTQENGTRTPTAASWTVLPEEAGAFSRQTASETYFRPDAPGRYTIQAAIGDTLVTQEVEIYGGFVLESNNILSHSGGTGFRFDIEVYEEEHDEADIYIEDNGTVRIPGGFVTRPEKYLHEVEGRVPMDGAKTSFGMHDAQHGIMVMQTRKGQQVALNLGVTVRGVVGGVGGYAYVFGHRVLD